MSSVNTHYSNHHHHSNHHGYGNNGSSKGAATRGSNNTTSSCSSSTSSSMTTSLLQQQQSSSSSSDNGSTGFLKIPRIRLKQKSSKEQQKHSSSSGISSSPPQQQSPTSTENSKNLKFSYIENSHLVNPVMMMQQQQKLIMGKGQKNRNSGDYSDEGEDNNEQSSNMNPESTSTTPSGRVLIKPKKLPNPIKESVAMQSIHRELLLNQKIGRSVLNHKTELQKALEKLATKNILDSENNDSSSTHLSELPYLHDKHVSVSSSSSTSVPPPPTMVLPIVGKPASTSMILPSNKNSDFQRILDARAKQIEDQKCFVDGVTKPPLIRESEFEKIHKRITSNNVNNK